MVGAIINWAERQDCTQRATPEDWAGGLRFYLKGRTLQFKPTKEATYEG